MERFISRILSLFLLIAVTGCSSVEPLSLNPYRKNIVIRSDSSILVENDVIDFRKFREELVKRMVIDKDRIVLHVHQNVPEKVFEAVYNQLLEYGYSNIQPVLYRD